MALRYQLQLACRLRDLAPLCSVASFARLNQAVKQPILLHAQKQHPSVLSCCRYAKGANRPKHSAKDAKPKVTLSDDELSEVVRIHSFRSEAQKVVQRLQDSFIKHLSLNSAADYRHGRAFVCATLQEALTLSLCTSMAKTTAWLRWPR